jgi:molybdopterin synthase sulfur carrier subunit
MNLTVRYFASIREAVGLGSEAMQTQAATLSDLRAELILRGGAYADALTPGRAVRMALNQNLCEGTVALTEGCEVAFFPPVTGG